MTKQTFTETLRRCIETSGKTRYEICQATGLDQGNLSRFMSQVSELKTSSIDLLCDFLALELVPKKPVAKQNRSKRQTKGK